MRVFPDQGGDGAVFQTKSETARPRWRQRGVPDQGGDGATFQTMAGSAPNPDIGERGAIFQTRMETPRPINNSSLDTERFSLTSNNLYFSPPKIRKSFKP